MTVSVYYELKLDLDPDQAGVDFNSPYGGDDAGVALRVSTSAPARSGNPQNSNGKISQMVSSLVFTIATPNGATGTATGLLSTFLLNLGNITNNDTGRRFTSGTLEQIIKDGTNTSTAYKLEFKKGGIIRAMSNGGSGDLIWTYQLDFEDALETRHMVDAGNKVLGVAGDVIELSTPGAGSWLGGTQRVIPGGYS